MGPAGARRRFAAGAPREAPEGERKQRGDLRGDAARLDESLVHAGHQGDVATGLAVREVTGEPAPIAEPQPAHRAQAPIFDGGLDLLAALSAGQFLVLLAELAARAEQAALHHLAGHVEL